MSVENQAFIQTIALSWPFKVTKDGNQKTKITTIDAAVDSTNARGTETDSNKKGCSQGVVSYPKEV